MLEFFDHLLLVQRQGSDHAVQEKRGFVQQAGRRLHVLDDDALGHRLQVRFVLRIEVLPGKDHHRHIGQCRLPVHFLEQLEPAHVGQAQVEYDAVEGSRMQGLQRFRAGTDGEQFDVVVSQQFDDGLPLDVVVLDHEQSFHAGFDKRLDAFECGFHAIGRRGLDEIGEGAVGQTVDAAFVHAGDLHGNVARGRVEFELVEHRPAEHVGKVDVEDDRRGPELFGQGETQRALVGDDALESAVARQIQKDARIVRVVLDDQQHHIAFGDRIAIVDDRLLAFDRQYDRSCERRSAGTEGRGAQRQTVGAHIVDGQIQRERTALASGAREFDFAAQQHRQLAADRQPEAGAAVFSRSTRIRLLEGLEDEPLFFRRHADAGVFDLESDHAFGLCEPGMVGTPAAGGQTHAHFDVTIGREFHGVRQQILQDLLQALGIAVHRSRHALRELHAERQVLGLGDMAEVALDVFAQTRERNLFDIDRDRPRLDLRQVEDVVDEMQQVGAGGIDVAREFDLLVGQVARTVAGELLTQDEDRVQGRAQLVRHVGEEFRLVLRRQRQFRGLGFERVTRMLDLGVLALHLRVLLGEQLGLAGQFFVGLLKFGLTRLELDGQLLRLGQQALGPHRRFDGIEYRADALREQVQERERAGAEGSQCRQFDDGLGLALEQHWQDDDADLLRLAETGRNPDEIRRHVREQDALLFDRALPDQAFAGTDGFMQWRRAGMGITGQLFELRFVAVVGQMVNGALMGIDQRRQFVEQQPADGIEFALALQHAGELGQVGLEPVLLAVALRGLAQVEDHRVDVVFQFRHFAFRIDLDGARQIALGHRGRHFGDRAHLRGQVGRQQVDVAGEILPGAGGAGYVRLSAQAAIDAHFARDVGHLVGERRQSVGHVVDGFGQGRDLALGLHGQLLAQIAVRDRSHHLHDAAHLFGEVGRHEVHVVGQVLPGAADARDLGLSTEFAFGAHLARDASHLAGE